jgi:hypothetical protein
MAAGSKDPELRAICGASKRTAFCSFTTVAWERPVAFRKVLSTNRQLHKHPGGNGPDPSLHSARTEHQADPRGVSSKTPVATSTINSATGPKSPNKQMVTAAEFMTYDVKYGVCLSMRTA